MVKLTEPQIEKIRNKRMQEQDYQSKLIAWENELFPTEKDILIRLHYLSYATWLFGGKWWPDDVYGWLKRKYVGQFVCKRATLTFKDSEST